MPSPETEVFYTPEDRAHDPREQEEWFQRLPEHAKREFREKWSEKEAFVPAHRAKRARTLKRHVLEGAIFFPIVYWMYFPLYFGGFIRALVVGAGLGFVAWRMRAGPHQWGLLGGLAYVLFHYWFVGSLLFGFGAVFGLVVFTFGSAAIGVGHVLHRYDMTE